MTTCMCGHDKADHGRADAQTGWQSSCWRDECECDDFTDSDDPCWTCGGRGCPDCRSWHYAPPTTVEITAGVCEHCRNYWDTPGHFYGCPVAADELHRSLQEEGL